MMETLEDAPDPFFGMMSVDPTLPSPFSIPQVGLPRDSSGGLSWWTHPDKTNSTCLFKANLEAALIRTYFHTVPTAKALIQALIVSQPWVSLSMSSSVHILTPLQLNTMLLPSFRHLLWLPTADRVLALELSMPRSRTSYRLLAYPLSIFGSQTLVWPPCPKDAMFTSFLVLFP